jgi:hypothetical protein
LVGTLVALISCAGCGGGGSDYSAAKTKDCLSGHGAQVSRSDADYIAAAAVNGGYLVSVGETQVNVSFYRNGGDAHDTLTGYEALAAARGRSYTSNAMQS